MFQIFKTKTLDWLPTENTARQLMSCVLQLKITSFELFVVFLQIKEIANYFFVVDNLFYRDIFNYLLDILI